MSATALRLDLARSIARQCLMPRFARQQCRSAVSQLINLREFTASAAPVSVPLRSRRHSGPCELAAQVVAPHSAQTAPPPNQQYRHRSSANGSPEQLMDSMADQDLQYMREALTEAMKGAAAGEVPVGAVLVYNGEIIARAHNSTIAKGDPVAHAEILCIQQAAAHLGGWRLLNSTLYVTLEPCAMCAGAMLQSRIGTLVYGARNSLSGADGSWVDLLPSKRSAQRGLLPRRSHPFHPDMQVRRGICCAESSALLKDFFRWRRTQPPTPNSCHIDDDMPLMADDLMLQQHDKL